MIRMKREVPDCREDIDKFLLPQGLPDVGFQIDRIELLETQLLRGLTVECFLKAFPVVHVTAHRRVPAAGKKVFPHRPLLDVQASLSVDDVKMDDRMHQF